MSLTSLVSKNTFVHLVGKIISLFLSLIIFSMITHYLGTEGFGQFTTVTSFLQVFAIFANLGLYLVFIQILSAPKTDEKKVISDFFSFRLISSIVLLFIAPLIALSIPQYSGLIKIGIFITVFSYIFTSLSQLLTGFFQTKMQIKKVVFAEIAGRLVLLILTESAILLKTHLIGILVALIFSSLVEFYVLYRFLGQQIKISLLPDFHAHLNIFKKSWPVALSMILTTVYFKGDTIILSLFQSQNDVGIYGASYRILETLILFPPIFVGLIMPYLSRSWAEKNLESFKMIFQKSFDFFMVIIWPLIIGTMCLAAPLMMFVAGADFLVSAPPLRILIWATGLIFLGTLSTYAVVAIEKQKLMLPFYFISALVGLIGYLIFIPTYSYYGAAYMTIVAELLTTALSFWIIYKTTKFLPNFKIGSKSLLASLIMGFFLLILSGQNLFFLIFVAIIIYFAALYFLKTISSQTIKEIANLK
ncbi:MAG: flippase [Patescibacteria group bacterium]